MSVRCGNCCAESSPFFSTKDWNRRHTGAEFEYARCPACGLIQLVEVPRDLGTYYGQDYYLTPTRPALERAAAAESYQLRHVTRHVGSGTLIEIGAAWGVFALLAKRSGFDVHAIEMDETCCEYLTDQVGVRAIRTARPEEVLPGLPNAMVIALWQTLEHLPRPFAVLDAAVDRLEPGGVLVVSTPNPGSLGFRILRSRWPHVDAPRHLWLFPPALLVQRMAARGLRCETLTTSDLGARRWNRFSWQRVLINHVEPRWARAIAFGLGTAVSVLAAPIEVTARRGSSFTAVFRKDARCS